MKAHPVVEFAKLKAGDQEYRLAYDFNAIADAEREAGCNLLQGMLLPSMATASQVRGLLYAALKKAHPKITLVQSGEIVRLVGVEKVWDAIAAAYTASIPKKEKNPTGAGRDAGGS